MMLIYEFDLHIVKRTEVQAHTKTEVST